MPQLKVQVFDDEHQLGRDLAGRIFDGIAQAAVRGTNYVLGCPGGRSLHSTYRALAKMATEKEGVDLSPLIIAMMDDYVAPHDNGFRPVAADVHFSCRRFAYDEIIGPLDGLAGAPGPDRVLFPDPAHPARYDQRLADNGGIDLFLLASGATDGHVAFNPPGSSSGSATRVVELAETTRLDNLHTFPDFESIDEVPTHGVTIGLGSIAQQSRAAVLVCSGNHKQATVRRVLDSEGFDPAWPATIIHECRAAELLVDRAAIGDIDLRRTAQV